MAIQTPDGPLTFEPVERVKVSREILEDRYDGGLVNLVSVTEAGVEHETAGDYNERRLRMDQLLFELWEATARSRFDGKAGPGDPIGEIENIIRAEIVRRVDESGLAE